MSGKLFQQKYRHEIIRTKEDLKIKAFEVRYGVVAQALKNVWESVADEEMEL